jgi:hypothetical protein
MESSPLTRRDWGALMAALPLAAQAPSTASVPASSSAADSAADDVRKTSDQLARIEIPMSLEPAFLFHV